MDAHKTDQYTVGQWAKAWFENYTKPSIWETTAAYYKDYIDKHIVPSDPIMFPSPVIARTASGGCTKPC